MVRLNRIYTRSGDGGRTSLVSGARISKAEPRMQAIGGVDETNAALGLARSARGPQTGQAAEGQADEKRADKSRDELDHMLERLQNDLFDLGADLAAPRPADRTEKPGEALRISKAQVRRLEEEIDRLNERLQPLNSFVLPGGSPLAAALHMARTICRRAERDMVALAEKQPREVNPEALAYVNRLSDLLFVMARIANNDGAADHLWTPGENR